MTKSSFLLPVHQVCTTLPHSKVFQAAAESNCMPLQSCPPHATEFGGSLDATGLLDFVDAGHDLLLAIDPDASDELRELAADLGVDFDTKSAVMTDHFNRHDQQQSAITTSNALESHTVFGSSYKHVRLLRAIL